MLIHYIIIKGFAVRFFRQKPSDETPGFVCKNIISGFFPVLCNENVKICYYYNVRIKYLGKESGFYEKTVFNFACGGSGFFFLPI